MVNRGNYEELINRHFDAGQISLFDEIEDHHEKSDEKTRSLEDTIFDLHTRYGRDILKTGKELEIHNKAHKYHEEKNNCCDATERRKL